MTLLQSINGAISEDYTLTLAFGIIGFLLVTIAGVVGNHFISTMKEIKEELKEHRGEIHSIKVDVATIKEGISNSNSDIAETIYAKIMAAKG